MTNNLNKSNQIIIKSTTPTYSPQLPHSPFNHLPTQHQNQTQTIDSIIDRPTLPRRIQIIHTRITNQGLKEVPSKFERCETDDLIELIGSMLDRLISHNDRIPLTSSSLTRFHSRSPPSITIQDYLKRILIYTNVEPICLLSILPYIDRICEKLSNFTICSLTVHRFCITSVTVCCKFLCDSFFANSRYAKVGGIGLIEMNLLEREFLIGIDYTLVTTGEVLNRYYLSLVQSHPSYALLPPSSDPSNSSTSSTARHSTVSTPPIENIENHSDSIELSIESSEKFKPEESVYEVENLECEVKENKETEMVIELQPLPDCIHDEEMG
ncbi:uncharacterized protein MELLADRAFT_117271 [Melampsora larici-populina 98AG31]|uniref:Cyclin-domain-containing protein n=1 Tax=Melampsora larici-populina (strain 98AG31 / pathotype 3-4-7) TaxID=747676 RepID=F4RVA7_MELLP|nr:uncharacterized protein MELLADRAFT_117271 [Melampsora larici-populina 98AG31]EGG03587.1 hypothetical protein MELLADRAFT_117271 [Melampsora larici-populina 98AG31]